MSAKEWRYVPGDFYRICDRTGFKVRASRTKKEWNGLIVRDKSWEPRHPQDFVRGRIDPQVVPEPRPRQQNRFIPTSITLPNLLVSSDEQALDWPGEVYVTPFPMKMGQPVGGMVLGMPGGTVDAVNYYASVSADAGSVKRLQVQANLSYFGWPNLLAFSPNGTTPVDLFQIVDLFAFPDLFGLFVNQYQGIPNSEPLVWNAYVLAKVQISTSNDGVNWTDWADCFNTVYTTRAIKLRLWIATFDINTAIFVTAFNYQIGLAS